MGVGDSGVPAYGLSVRRCFHTAPQPPVLKEAALLRSQPGILTMRRRQELTRGFSVSQRAAPQASGSVIRRS